MTSLRGREEGNWFLTDCKSREGRWVNGGVVNSTWALFICSFYCCVSFTTALCPLRSPLFAPCFCRTFSVAVDVLFKRNQCISYYSVVVAVESMYSPLQCGGCCFVEKESMHFPQPRCSSIYVLQFYTGLGASNLLVAERVLLASQKSRCKLWYLGGLGCWGANLAVHIYAALTACSSAIKIYLTGYELRFDATYLSFVPLLSDNFPLRSDSLFLSPIAFNSYDRYSKALRAADQRQESGHGHTLFVDSTAAIDRARTDARRPQPGLHHRGYGGLRSVARPRQRGDHSLGLRIQRGSRQ